MDSDRPRSLQRLRFLDRMPERAARAPLKDELAVFETFVRGSRKNRARCYDSDEVRSGTSAESATWAPAGTDDVLLQPSPPSDAQRDVYKALCAQNVTCFTDGEEQHPINFFEQRDVCQHCGAERFRTMDPALCCQHGQLVLHRNMPAELLHLMTTPPGLSKQSRAANDLFRFAQMALPKGTHRIPDSYQHLKITGVPHYAVNQGGGVNATTDVNSSVGRRAGPSRRSKFSLKCECDEFEIPLYTRAGRLGRARLRADPRHVCGVGRVFGGRLGDGSLPGCWSRQ